MGRISLLKCFGNQQGSSRLQELQNLGLRCWSMWTICLLGGLKEEVPAGWALGNSVPRGTDWHSETWPEPQKRVPASSYVPLSHPYCTPVTPPKWYSITSTWEFSLQHSLCVYETLRKKRKKKFCKHTKKIHML